MGKVNKLKLASYKPADSIEKVARLKSRKYVKYGTKNDYPNYLLDLAETSPTHGTLLKSKARLVFGDGLIGRDDSAIKISKLGLNKTIKRGVKDFETFDGFYLELIWTKDRTEIGEINHIPFEQVRPLEKEEGEIKGYYVNEDWKNDRDAVFVDAFNPDNTKAAPRQLLFVGDLNGYFPTPSYKSAVNYIELEKSLAMYFVMHVKNGLHPGFMVVFKDGEPDEDLKRKMRSEIESNLMGEDNTNKFFIVYVDEDEEKPEFITLDVPDPSDQYTTLNDIAPEKIMIAHAVVSPMLFGLKNSTGLGNNAEELDTARELLEEGYIIPRQNTIEEGLAPLFAELGISASFKRVKEEDIIADKAFTGIQISSAVGVIQAVNTGQLTSDQAISILVNMLQFNEDEARSLFTSSLNLSLVDNEWIDLLSDKGDKIEDWDGEWELVSEETCTTHEDEANVKAGIERQLNLMQFASADDADASASSKWGDSGLYKLRYVYKRAKPSSGKSRPFCETMENLGNQGVMFRYEDIALGQAGSLSDQGENGQFAPKGKSAYDIFLYKGGVNCHHIWQRQIYFRKRDANGRFLPKSETDSLENDKRVGNVPFVPKKGEEGRPEIDKPNNGRLNFMDTLKSKLWP